MGLTDNTQSTIVFISLILMGIGAVSVPLDLPNHGIIAAGFWIAGIIGMVIKEKLGTVSNTAQVPFQPSNIPSPPPSTQIPTTSPTQEGTFTPES